MSELEIPERALEAAWLEDTPGGIRAAAPIIVADELRRPAAELWDEDHLGPAKKLANRANELDPEGSP